MHGAGAALRDAAAVFGAGQADLFPQHPEQGRVGVDIDLMSFSIDAESSHIAVLPSAAIRAATRHSSGDV
jgi:hypothetical protein